MSRECLLYKSSSQPIAETPRPTQETVFHPKLTLQLLPRDDQINDQIAVINAAYNNTGVSWNLQNITRTENADWYVVTCALFPFS
jgi:hypothetical protein